MRRYFFIAIAMFVLTCKSFSQVDPHFSQFYAYPLWLNPGMTGGMDGSYRITGIYRNQWSDVMVPFTTAGVSLDVSTEKNLNVGMNFMSQTAGDAGYKYLNGYATIAYSGVRFGQDNAHQIIAGVQIGMISRRFDPAKFQFGEQWNAITGFDPGTTSGDVIANPSSSSMDVGAGLSYFDTRSASNVNFFGGFAAFHLTRPEDPFFSGGTKRFLPVRYSLHAGARINLSDVASITPNILFMRQGNAEEKMAGLFTQLNINSYTDLLFGVNYRVKDAVSPYVGVAFQNFALGVSYDVNTSDLSKAVSGANSIEVSFTYIGKKTGKPLRYLSCPRF